VLALTTSELCCRCWRRRNAIPSTLASSTGVRPLSLSRFVGGDVFRSVKLTAGQGTLFCMNLCRADENCWSFNLNKNRKTCFLQTTGNDVTSQRASTWASGYRECVPSEGAWDNANTDAADDGATLVVATGGAAQVALSWTLAANDAYYTATYKAIVVADGATCDATPLASTDVAAGGTSATVTGLAVTGAVGKYLLL
jgi:hypothetical protein